MAPPVSNNWGFINDPEFDKLVAAVRIAFDPAERDKVLAALREPVDEAAFCGSPEAQPARHDAEDQGFVQPKSWFVDFSTTSSTDDLGRHPSRRGALACPGEPR